MNQNMLLKARAGRRIAIMLRTFRKEKIAGRSNLQTAANMGAQRPVSHQSLKRIALSEERVSRLSLA